MRDEPKLSDEWQGISPLSFWEIELRKILNGERDARIRRLGSVQEYAHWVLARANDLALSETALRNALRNIIQEWQPTTISSDRQISRMLDLILAYLPLNGEWKIIGYMKSRGRFGERIYASNT